MLVEYISSARGSFWHIALEFAREAALGAVIGVIGGRLVVLALNRVALPQGQDMRAVRDHGRVSSSRRPDGAPGRDFSRFISPASSSAIIRPGRITRW